MKLGLVVRVAHSPEGVSAAAAVLAELIGGVRPPGRAKYGYQLHQFHPCNQVLVCFFLYEMPLVLISFRLYIMPFAHGGAGGRSVGHDPCRPAVQRPLLAAKQVGQGPAPEAADEGGVRHQNVLSRAEEKQGPLGTAIWGGPEGEIRRGAQRIENHP